MFEKLRTSMNMFEGLGISAICEVFYTQNVIALPCDLLWKRDFDISHYMQCLGTSVSISVGSSVPLGSTWNKKYLRGFVLCEEWASFSRLILYTCCYMR